MAADSVSLDAIPVTPEPATWRRVAGRCGLGTLLVIPVLALILLPLVRIFLGPSFDSGHLSFGFLLASWTRPRLRGALVNTLEASLATSVVATMVGTLFALLTVRTDMPFRRMASALIVSAFVTSSYLMAFAYVLLLGPNAGVINRAIDSVLGLKSSLFDIYSFSGYIFVASLEGVPLAFLTCAAALHHIDGSLENSARILGARSARVLLTITLPIVLPAIGASALLVFISTLSLYGAPEVLGVRVVPTEIQALLGYPPHFDLAAGVSVFLILPALASLLLYRLLTRRSGRFVTISGKAEQTEPISLGRLRWVAFALVAFYIVLALVLPYAMLLSAAFSVAAGDGLTRHNLTLANFAFAFHDSLTMRALRNSVFIGTLTAATATLVAAAIAMGQARARHGIRHSVTDVITMLPFGIPSIVIAVGVILSFIGPPVQLYGTIWIICLAMFIKFLPIAIRALAPVFAQIDGSLEDASRICGATPLTTWTRITIPLARKGLIAAALLVFVPAFRELGASMILTSPFNETIAFALMRAWGAVSFEVACTIGVLMLIVTLLVQITAARVGGSASR